MYVEEIRVGAEVDAYCTKCRMVTNHRIVAMMDDVIKRVICLTCDGQHNYRQPPGEKKKTASARRVAKDQKRSRTIAPKTFKKWLDLKEGGAVEEQARPYNMAETYSEGEAINHSKFGLGFIQKVMNGGKIEVMFEKEIKILVMDYQA